MTKKEFSKFLSVIILVLIAIYNFYNGELVNKEEKTNDINYKKTEDVINTHVTGMVRVSFLDVGQADSILVSSNGEYMLIDAGNNEDGEKLVKYLHEIGVKNFSYVIGTHAHEDHIGGMDDIIENFTIENFYMPDVITTTRTFEDVLDALEAKSVAFETPEVDSTFSFADCKFEVLYVGNDSNDLNDTSIVLKMTHDIKSFLFMGDATSKVEKNILNKKLKSDVLKVGHHGSNYSTTQEFLEKVSPDYSIIQVGVNNSYKHPTYSTLERLKNIGSKIYRTDEDGTITVTSDGNNLSFKTIKTDING